jgi:hypothetical protein
MTDSTTHIDTLRVQVPEEAAQQVRLRLSTTLGGADLHPPGLAPSEVLLVRELSDPEPGRLGLENAGAMLDRTWERAAREALADCLRRAVRPTNGRVPPGAEAVLFDDAAEAWACWARERVAGGGAAAAPWWTESLETSSDAPSSPAGRSLSMAAVWRARPRLVPAMAAHLAAWDVAVEVVGQMAEPETENVLRTVCDAFDVQAPPKSKPSPGPMDDEAPTPRSASSGLDEQSETDGGPPEESKREVPSVPPDGPPWTSFVEEAVGPRLVDALTQESPAYQQLLGVALTLRDRPVTARSPSFQSAWRAWRHSVQRSAESRDRSSEGEGAMPDRHASEAERSSSADAQERPSREDDLPPVDDLALNGDRRAAEPETTPEGEGEEPSWEDAYTATELGGVLYLVNVLDALNLPDAAEVPPVGEHVGAWAVLEALARALLGPDDDTLRPNDPLWRVLTTLDGRGPDVPAGRALDEAAGYRMPPAWLEAPRVDAPVQGRWTVKDGWLRVWTDFGCVADLEASDDPAAQAEAAWDQLPNTGHLRRAESPDAMPRTPAPDACAPALARWAARAAPYVRHRLAAALGVEATRSDGATAGSEESDWVADLFTVDARLYTTDLNVDLVCPLDAADLNARVAGLDQSPGWWAAGGRIVRFHFRDSEV